MEGGPYSYMHIMTWGDGVATLTSASVKGQM